MTAQEAIKNLEVFTTDEAQRLTSSEFDDSITMAIEALEKQIPKKIVENRWIYTKCDCGHCFSVHHGDGYYSIPYSEKTNYCPDCGQKLDCGE